jgi:hypothetical protein
MGLLKLLAILLIGLVALLTLIGLYIIVSIFILKSDKIQIPFFPKLKVIPNTYDFAVIHPASI